MIFTLDLISGNCELWLNKDTEELLPILLCIVPNVVKLWLNMRWVETE